MESWVQSWRPRANAFCDFPTCLWSIAPATKKWGQVVRSVAHVTQNHLPKTEVWSCVLDVFTSNCASCHNAVHVLNISSSKSAPMLVCFVRFYFDACFAPQRRALFSTSQLPKVLRTWVLLCILISKCASRRRGVQFFISHLPRRLRTRRFSEPTFRPSGATNLRKNTVFRDFATFSCTCIFCLLTLSLLWSSFFFSSLVWLFPSAFSSVDIVGSLASKLPFEQIYYRSSWNFCLSWSTFIFSYLHPFLSVFSYLHLSSPIFLYPIYPELSSSFFIYFHLFSFCWQPENCSYRTGSFFPQSFLSRGVAVVWDGFRHSKWLRLGDGLLHFAELCQGYRDENHRRSAAATDK